MRAIRVAGLEAEVRLTEPRTRVEAPLAERTAIANLRTMPIHLPSVTKSEPSPQVVRLIDRLKRLVAEQRHLDENDREDRRDANRREIGRLKWRLANAVKRELSPGPGLRPALAITR